jgi:hypothetical protein
MMAVPFEMITAILYEFTRISENAIANKTASSSTPIKITSASPMINYHQAFELVKSRNFYETKLLDLPSLLFETNDEHVVMQSPAKRRILTKSHSRDEAKMVETNKIVVLPGLQFKM